MKDPQETKKEFDSKISLFKRLEEEAKFIIIQEIEKESIKTQLITSRIKPFESFQNKINRKNIENPFQEINDIVGIRIVTLLRSGLPLIGDIIRKNFDVISEDNKIDDAAVESFGYLSIHFVVKLKNICSGPRYTGILEMPFEIQTRTMAMEAWATLSHYLDYKTESDVPSELKKDFFALSGLFYVADTHFEMFYNSRQKSKTDAGIRINEEITYLKEEINLDTLSAYLIKKYPDRFNSSQKDLSIFISQLDLNKYPTIASLDNMLNTTAEAFAHYESENPTTSKVSNNKYFDLGVLRLSMAIYDDEYAKQAKARPFEFAKYKKYLKKT